MMSIKVAVTSGKGGVGKTTTVANLGIALARLGVDVTVVDANFSTPDLSMHFGSSATEKTIHHALAGSVDLLDAVYIHPSGLKIIPASIALEDLEKLDYSKLKKLVDKIPGEVILFDTAAGLGEEMQNIIRIADKTVVVTNPEWPAITDALKAAIVSESHGVPVDGVIVNKIGLDSFEPGSESIEAILDAPVIASIPHDHSIRKSISTKNPAVISSPSSKAAEAYNELAHSLIGLPYEKPGFSLERFIAKLFG